MPIIRFCGKSGRQLLLLTEQSLVNRDSVIAVYCVTLVLSVQHMRRRQRWCWVHELLKEER
jgi:hypothetical protein